jgi:8-oxo-dGTP diphosphatase
MANVVRRFPDRSRASGPPTVRAAGGILLRSGRRGTLETALVHRPGREDWSFPKGKLEADESFEACALREVHEETGYRCQLGAFAGCTAYTDRRDRPKIVAYWYMDPAPEGSFLRRGPAAVDEVDEVRWVAVAEAPKLLTYPHDRQLIGTLRPEEISLLG